MTARADINNIRDAADLDETGKAAGKTISVGPDGIQYVLSDAGATDADLAAHAADTSAVHGIADTTVLATDAEVAAAVAAHVNDASAAHLASAIEYDPLLGGDLSSETVQDALDELSVEKAEAAAVAADVAALAAHLADTVDAHDASAVSFVPTGTVAATNVQTAIAEVASEAGSGSGAVQANLDAHLADTTDAHDASAISILDAANDFAATNVETALAELQAADEADEAALAAHISDATAAHPASAVSIVDSAGDFTATEVEGALAELQSDAEALAATAAAGDAALAAADTALDAAKADKTVTLTAGDGLSGGGDLSASRSFAVNVDGTTVELSGDALRVKDGGITDNKLNSEAAPAGHIATTDGLGGVSYEAPAAAAAGASGTFFWAFDDTTTAPPATGTLRLDDTPQGDALAIYFHEMDDDGVARTLWLSLLAKGDRIVISEEDDATKYVTYEISDPPIDQGTYWEIPVEVFVDGGALEDAERCGVTFLLGAGGGSGETILREIEQTAHNLDVGDWIRLDSSGDYVKAQADSVDNAECLGVVIEEDPNVFVFALFGWIDPDLAVFTGLTPGETYFLSDTVAGAMVETDDQPLSPGTVSKPLFTAAAADSGWVRELRGMHNADPIADTPFTREARTSNTKLVLADKGKTIDITTGGFTQTIDDAAVLGNGWWVLIRNNTLAPVTLDADGGDTIDGAVVRVLHPGESLMLLCDGSNFISVQVTEAYPWTIIRKSADESVNTLTVVQDDNELFFTTVAGAMYEIEVFLIYGSPVGGATPDMKVDFGEDGTTRGMATSRGLTTADAANTGAGVVSTAMVHTAGTAAANRVYQSSMTLFGNGGTFKVRWAQNTSNANDLTMRAGSILKYRRIL